MVPSFDPLPIVKNVDVHLDVNIGFIRLKKFLIYFHLLFLVIRLWFYVTQRSFLQILTPTP